MPLDNLSGTQVQKITSLDPAHPRPSHLSLAVVNAPLTQSLSSAEDKPLLSTLSPCLLVILVPRHLKPISFQTELSICPPPPLFSLNDSSQKWEWLFPHLLQPVSHHDLLISRTPQAPLLLSMPFVTALVQPPAGSRLTTVKSSCLQSHSRQPTFLRAARDIFGKCHPTAPFHCFKLQQPFLKLCF